MGIPRDRFPTPVAQGSARAVAVVAQPMAQFGGLPALMFGVRPLGLPTPQHYGENPVHETFVIACAA